MLKLWIGFLSGLGDKSNIFINDRIAREMQKSAGIEKARSNYYTLNKTEGFYNFGGKGLLDASFYPIQQFVGSYNYKITANPEGNYLMYTNTTSFASGALHLFPYKWNWTKGPMGNTQQTFIFTEPIKR